MIEDITPTEETYDDPMSMSEEEALDDAYHSIPLPDSPQSSAQHDTLPKVTSALNLAIPVTAV